MDTGCPHAVQFICPGYNTLHLELEQLKCTLKGRSVVFVSIANAMRCGQSFLLNLFVKYLNAQYRRQDIAKWMGNCIIQGFQWQKGRKRTTVGVWMWQNESETNFGYHDGKIVAETMAKNGDKTADMVEIRRHTANTLDTIGIFLMPGTKAGNEFAGDHDFLNYVGESVHLLFVPGHLTMKLISGERGLASDLVKCMSPHVNGKDLPEVDTIYMAAEKVVNSILIKKRMQFYTCSVTKKSVTKHPYSAPVFLRYHEHFMHRAAKMVNAKVGSREAYATMEKEFLYFNEESDEKLKWKNIEKTVFVPAGVATVLGAIAIETQTEQRSKLR